MNCGSAKQVDLRSESATIDIPISPARCDTDEFTPSAFRYNGSPKALTLSTCKSLSGVTDFNANCETTKGLSKSYRLRLVELRENVDNKTGLTTGCIPLSSSAEIAITRVLPYGGADGLFSFAIESFTDTSCAAGKRTYFLPRGLPENKPDYRIFTDTATARAYVLHGGVALTGTIDFGLMIAPVNTTGSISFVNNSGIDVTFGGATLSNSSPLRFEGSAFPGIGNCAAGLVIADNSSCTMTTEFISSGFGAFENILNVSYTFDGNPVANNLITKLRGKAVTNANLVFGHTLTPFDFGTVPFGVNPIQRWYKIKNNGGHPATISSIVPADGAFAVDSGTCSSPVNPGQTCDFSLTFNPATVTTYNGLLNITYHDGSIPTASLAAMVSANVISAPNLHIAVPLSTLSNVDVGSNGFFDFAILNNSDSTVNNISLSGLEGEYTRDPGVSQNCGTSLLPAVTCYIRIRITPTSAGYKLKNFDVSYDNTFGIVTKQITFQANALGAGTLIFSATDFGNAAVGGSVEKVITIINDTFNQPVSNITGHAFSSARFDFNNSSYAGAGGTCTAGITTGGSCTVVLKYTPDAYIPQTANYTFTYDIGGVTKTLTLPLSGTGSTPTTVTTNIASHTFLETAIGTPSNVNVVVSNMTATPATLISFNGLSSPYLITSNSCPAVLGAFQGCTLSVRFQPNAIPQVSDTLDIVYNNGVADQTLSVNFSGRGFISGPVLPYYSNATNWNSYVYDSSPSSLFSDSNTACIPSSHSNCHHAGELKRIDLPGLTDCQDIVIQENLNAFEWECFDNNNTGPVQVRTRGLKRGFGLKDLVTPTGWKNNHVLITDGSPAKKVFQSAPAPWWTNTVRSLQPIAGTQVGDMLNATILSLPGIAAYDGSNSPGVPVRTFKLTESGTIYVMPIGGLVPSLTIAADYISVVTLDGGSLSTWNASSPTCNSATGSSGSPNKRTLICGNQPFTWIEILGFGAGTNDTEAVIYLKNSPYSRIHASTIFGAMNGVETNQVAPRGPIYMTNTRFGPVTNDAVIGTNPRYEVRHSDFISSTNGLKLTGNSGEGSIIEHSNFIDNSGAGLSLLVVVNNNRIRNIQSAQNGYGVKVDSTGNKFRNVKTSGNSLSGIFMDSGNSNNNTFVDVLSVNNEFYGLKMNNSISNTFQNATFANNNRGILLTSSNYNTFVNMVVFNTLTSEPGIELSSSLNNHFKHLAISRTSQSIKMEAASNNSFSATITGHHYSGNDCDVLTSGSNNFVNGTAINFGSPHPTCPGPNSSLDLDDAFAGRLSSDFDNAYVSASPAPFNQILYELFTYWNKDYGPFRAWGTNAPNPVTAVGISGCQAGGTCSAWDWSLKPFTSDIYNQSVTGNSPNDTFNEGGSCPTGVSGSDVMSDAQTAVNEFMLLAVEADMVPGGDKDGLCEDGETCIYSPNFGRYQGVGNLTPTSCTFTPGSVTGVVLKAFATN